MIHHSLDALEELAIIEHQVSEIANRRFSDADDQVPFTARRVLRTLRQTGPATISNIARERSITRQHARTIIQRFLDMGLVESLRNPGHRTAHLIKLSEAGSEFINQHDVRMSHFLDSLFQGQVDRDEWKIILDISHRVRVVFSDYLLEET